MTDPETCQDCGVLYDPDVADDCPVCGDGGALSFIGEEDNDVDGWGFL
jgi:hypothetical protein